MTWHAVKRCSAADAAATHRCRLPARPTSTNPQRRIRARHDRGDHCPCGADACIGRSPLRLAKSHGGIRWAEACHRGHGGADDGPATLSRRRQGAIRQPGQVCDHAMTGNGQARRWEALRGRLLSAPFPVSAGDRPECEARSGDPARPCTEPRRAASGPQPHPPVAPTLNFQPR